MNKNTHPRWKSGAENTFTLRLLSASFWIVKKFTCNDFYLWEKIYDALSLFIFNKVSYAQIRTKVLCADRVIYTFARIKGSNKMNQKTKYAHV